MPLYRATAVGQPIGPWCAHREVALLDAVEAHEATLYPDTSMIYVGVLTRIEKEEGDELVTRDEDVMAAAIDALYHHGNRAPVSAEEQARGFDGQRNAAGRRRRIGSEAERLLRAAERRRGAELKAEADDGRNY